MARKLYDGSGTLEGMEEAPRPRVRSAAPKRPDFPWRRLAAIVGAIAVVLAGSLYSLHKLEQFLIRDERFLLGSDDSDRPALEISGVSHASRRAIENVFNDDAGRSVYLLPLEQRRANLRSVDWVKDASIIRLWPNRVIVQISERAPVAFLTLDSSKFALIDDDGIILPPAPDRFTLPVLAGVRVSDAVERRRDRVRRMMRVTRELGSDTQKISEIDVSDPDNIKVTQPCEGRMITLMLGDHDYGLRYQNFVRNYSEIQRRLPGAATLDMRIEDRITVVE